ncbi:MAG: hypothetical protein ABFS35_13365 [Bacteroidota bacterium]
MSFGGSVSAMITSLKNNSRQKKKLLFDKKDTNWKKVPVKLKKFREKKATQKQLRKIRTKLLAENSRDTYKKVVALGLALLIVSWLIYWFFYT